MEIEIKNFMSPDILDFKNFVPTDKKSFSFLLEFEIGIKEKKGGDLFSIEVCTPQWLIENYQSSDIVFCNNKLIVFEYNIENIINEIKRYLRSITGSTWEDIATQISKVAHWEFENYKSKIPTKPQ